jgi:hypothetical protein
MREETKVEIGLKTCVERAVERLRPRHWVLVPGTRAGTQKVRAFLTIITLCAYCFSDSKTN